MPLFLLFLLLGGLLIWATPNNLIKFFLGLYVVGMYLIVAGLHGFAEAADPKDGSLLTFYLLYIFLLLLHLPLVYRLISLNQKHHRLHRARHHFGRDVIHYSNEQLHLHLHKKH